MKSLSIIQSVELFHLLFLDFLGRKIEKKLYALKGGCNLRFFLKSIRYSQDIDLDVQTIRKDTLRNLVNKILQSTPFHMVLQTKGMSIDEISEPKQTETTQRWKIKLLALNAASINTKIEFSRRGIDDMLHFDAIDSLIIQNYQLSPILANHYTREAAFKQKISTLALRNETQARDVFDLHHLLNMGVGCPRSADELKDQRKKAIENAIALSHDEFLGQVVAFLPLDYQQQYRPIEMWNTILDRVVEKLSEGI
jgi:predicted nucleotidyltransferase component of viral defense system